jgi:hypothetical protein
MMGIRERESKVGMFRDDQPCGGLKRYAATQKNPTGDI